MFVQFFVSIQVVENGDGVPAEREAKGGRNALTGGRHLLKGIGFVQKAGFGEDGDKQVLTALIPDIGE